MLYKSFLSRSPNRINSIKNKIPKQFNCYIDLAINEGDLFINLAPKKYIINENNGSIYNMWKAIYDTPYELCEYISKYSNCQKEDCTFNESLVPSHAAMFMYLQDYKYIHQTDTNFPEVYFDNIKNISKYMNSNKGYVSNIRADQICDHIDIGKDDFIFLDCKYINRTDIKVGIPNSMKSIDKKNSKFLLIQQNTEHNRQQFQDFNIEQTDFDKDTIYISNY